MPQLLSQFPCCCPWCSQQNVCGSENMSVRSLHSVYIFFNCGTTPSKAQQGLAPCLWNPLLSQAGPYTSSFLCSVACVLSPRRKPVPSLQALSKGFLQAVHHSRTSHTHAILFTALSTCVMSSLLYIKVLYTPVLRPQRWRVC